MNFKPKNKSVLIHQVEAEKTVGSIHVPTMQAPNEGTIVAIGKGVKDFKVGEYVAFSSFVGTELEITGVKYLLMAEEDVLGTFDIEPQETT